MNFPDNYPDFHKKYYEEWFYVNNYQYANWTVVWLLGNYDTVKIGNYLNDHVGSRGDDWIHPVLGLYLIKDTNKALIFKLSTNRRD